MDRCVEMLLSGRLTKEEYLLYIRDNYTAEQSSWFLIKVKQLNGSILRLLKEAILSTTPVHTTDTSQGYSASAEQLERLYGTKTYKLDARDEGGTRLVLTEPRNSLESFLKNSGYPKKLSAEEWPSQQQQKHSMGPGAPSPASNLNMQQPLLFQTSAKQEISLVDLKKRMDSIASEFGLSAVDPDCLDVMQYALECHLKNIISTSQRSLKKNGEEQMTRRDLQIALKIQPHALVENIEFLEAEN